ncbi:histidine kinase, partial [Streptomyces sp. 15-116A]|nr:histidine kinase [Streptomyces sp. 15-116A]
GTGEPVVPGVVGTHRAGPRSGYGAACGAAGRNGSTASGTPAEPAPGGKGLTPLPRRVPRTSLVAELCDEAPAAIEEDGLDDFTPERAASSLAGFQRGTLRAREDEAAASHGPPCDSADSVAHAPVPVASSEPAPPPADR